MIVPIHMSHAGLMLHTAHQMSIFLKDVRAMWYLLDKDNNGSVTLEEFDYDGAQDRPCH